MLRAREWSLWGHIIKLNSYWNPHIWSLHVWIGDIMKCVVTLPAYPHGALIRPIFTLGTHIKPIWSASTVHGFGKKVLIFYVTFYLYLSSYGIQLCSWTISSNCWSATIVTYMGIFMRSFLRLFSSRFLCIVFLTNDIPVLMAFNIICTRTESTPD